MLSDGDIEILKAKKVYCNNKSVSEVITDIDESIDLCDQQISIYNQIIELKRQSSKRINEIKDDESSLQKVLDEVKEYKRIRIYLNNLPDLRINIQEIVK